MLKSVARSVENGIKHSWAVFLMVALLASVIDVTNRLMGGRGFAWCHDISMWAVIFFSFLCVGAAISDHSHIKVDFILERLKGRVRKFFECFSTVMILLFCGLVSYSGIVYVSYLIRRKGAFYCGVWLIPTWPILAFSLTLGFLIATIYAVLRLLKELKRERS